MNLQTARGGGPGAVLMYHRIVSRSGCWLAALCFLLGAADSRASSDVCDVCGGPFGEHIYLFQDKVTGEMKHVCGNCARLSTVCYVCGVPVKSGYKTLSDGRVICARDAANVVLDGDDGQRVFDEVETTLNRSLSRFMTFPEGDVAFGMTDRVNIQELFKFAGNDYTCPNVWGYYQPNRGEASPGTAHFIFVLSGLPRGAFRATCAHELTHAWVHENLSASRLARLSKDTHEGFCELIAYKLACAEGDEAAKRQILANQYTRGQINLFIAAQERYGFNDVVDWMKYGDDSQLYPDELERVRNVTMPRRAARVSTAPIVYPPAPPPPDHLVLKGIFWSANHPAASINGRLLGPGETARIRLASTNVLIRCVSVTETEAEILQVDSGAKQVLKFSQAQ